MRTRFAGTASWRRAHSQWGQAGTPPVARPPRHADRDTKAEDAAWIGKRIDSLRKLSERERAILGFLVAPLVPALVLTLPAALQQSPIASTLLVRYATVSYCATLLVAIPAHILLWKRHWTLLSIYAAVGAAMGLAVFLFTLIYQVPARAAGLGPVTGRLLSLPVDVIGGVMVLVCFWLIARPDRE